MSKCDLNKVASNFVEITLRHGCSSTNLLHIFRAPFYKNTSGGLLLIMLKIFINVILKLRFSFCITKCLE